MKKDTLLINLRKACDRIAVDQVINDQVSQYCLDKYNVPLGRSKDIISDRVSINDLSDSDLFYLCDAVGKQIKTIIITDYFDLEEIKKYKKTKYQKGKINWPIRIPCIQILSGDRCNQWIGRISAKELIKLNESELINYNPNKQRALTRIVDGNNIEYKITLVTKSVKEIQELMETGEYIPDDITLDIPEELDVEMRYDDTFHELVFDKIDHFDITDGYHRFMAILKCAEKNPGFDYSMEVRITQFSAQRTRQFIYQKDQKNKMTKSESRSMSAFRHSNEVVALLNERSSGCMLSGTFTRDNSSRIDIATLSDLIEYYWIRQYKHKKITNKMLLEIMQEVKDILNRIVTEDSSYFDEKYLASNRLILLFWLIKGKGHTPEEAVSILNKNVDNKKLGQIKSQVIRKPLFDRLEALDLQ